MKAHPTHLYALLLNDRKFDLLDSALKQTRVRMEAEGEIELWKYWDGMRLAAKGAFEDAAEIASSLRADLKTALDRTVALERARQSGNWLELATLLESRWNKSKDAGDLLALCETKLNAGDPQFVADRAAQLVKEVGTPVALRIATSATSRVGAWRACLSLLDANLALFPKDQLPADLRRLRVACEQNLGMLSEAMRDAESLAADEKSISNLTLLFDLRVRSGRLADAAESAKNIVDSPDAPTGTLVHVGWLMRLEDKLLSEAALKRAVEKGIDEPEHVAMATMLANELALPAISTALMPKMAAAAAIPGSGIAALSLGETIGLIRERVERSHQALEVFTCGSMPVHLLSEMLRTPLALWPVLALADRTRYAPGAVFFRHGGKAADGKPGRVFDRVYFDVTALINAHELELLPLVEKIFGSISVPSAVRASLVQQLDHLARGSSTEDSARGEVLDLLDSGRISAWDGVIAVPTEGSWREGLPSEWCDVLVEARSRGGLVADYWPKLKDNGTAWIPPAELGAQLTNAVALVRSLEDLGLLSKTQSNAAIEQLASVSTGGSDNRPSAKQAVFLTTGIAKQLARAKVLYAVADAFSVILPAGEVAILRGEEATTQDKKFVSSRLRSLLNYISESAAYEELVLREEVQPIGSEKTFDAAPYCIAELLQAEAGPNRWTWSDDRWLNGYKHIANVPVVSTAEVIGELRVRGLIAETEYFRLRHRLRAADFRYLPIEAEELVYFLRQATHEKDGVLSETVELAMLRQYWSRALCDRNTLQIPPAPEGASNAQGEVEFFNGSVRAMHDVFVAIFAEASDPAIVQARATWLLYWMWCPVEHFAAILGREIDFVSFDKLRGSGECLFVARMLDAKAFKSEAALKLYGEWLGAQLYDDASRSTDLSRQVLRTLEQLASKVQKKTLNDKAHCLVLNRWFFSFPDWLREGIHLSPKTRHRLGIRNRSVVSVGIEQFESDEFWRAAETAFKGKPVDLTSVDKKLRYVLTIQKKPSGPVVLLERTGENQKWGFEDPAIGLLDSRESRRISLLNAHPEWFDSCDIPAGLHIAKIARLETPKDRVVALDHIRIKSAWLRYIALAEKCGRKQGPTVVEMSVRDVESHLVFLRCENSDSGPIDWDTAARRLVDSVGIQQAFSRLACIPSALPPSFLAAFDSISASKREVLVRNWEKSVRSPIAKTHLFRLLLRQKAWSSTFADDLVSEAIREETDALIQLAQWVWNQLGRLPGPITPSARLAITWSHSGQLFELLRGVSTASHIVEFFEKLDQQANGEVLVRAKGEDDIAFPRHVTTEVLLASAVGCAIAIEPESGFQPSPQMLQSVAALCTMPGKEVDLPRLEWLYDPSSFTNLLDTFISQNRELYLRPFASERVATFINSGEFARQLDALVGAVEGDLANGNAWIMLGAVMRGRPCPPPLKARVGVLMRSMKFSDLPGEEAMRSGTILGLAAQAAEVGGDELVAQWRVRIAELARWLGGLDGDSESRDRRRQMVLRCSVTLARHGPVTNPVRCFSDTILASRAAWPGLDTTLVGMLRLLSGLPHDQLASAWGLILALRCVAKQQNNN
jgi:hypothetical protein